MHEFRANAIATVRNARHDLDDDTGWGAVESVIETEPDRAAGLEGLADFSHVLVVFHLHRDPGEAPALRRRPRGRADMPLVGVFAQRGRNRPNPIGVSVASIVRVEPGRLVVRGLDAVDGTPVLDLKPYVPAFDRREARVPAWMDELMRGYFERGAADRPGA
jgi:tRNA-Thr(GGU) m(6)t(6)A37 methyltransferase TsaA